MWRTRQVGFSKGGQNWPQICSTSLHFQDTGFWNFFLKKKVSKNQWKSFLSLFKHYIMQFFLQFDVIIYKLGLRLQLLAYWYTLVLEMAFSVLIKIKRECAISFYFIKEIFIWIWTENVGGAISVLIPIKRESILIYHIIFRTTGSAMAKCKI